MSEVVLQVRKQSWFQDFKDTVSLKSLFAYNNKLIPPDPDFFSAGISFESDDKWEFSDKLLNYWDYWYHLGLS